MDKQNVLNATFIRSKADDEARAVPAVLSTEAPVQRSGFEETLIHKQNSIDLTRFPLPVIVSHDPKNVNVAIASDPVISGGRLLATVKFGGSNEARQLYDDVKAGIVRNLSVGYKLSLIHI